MVLCGVIMDGQDGAAAEAIQAEVGKLQELKAVLAKATAAAESTSTFDRKGTHDRVFKISWPVLRPRCATTVVVDVVALWPCFVSCFLEFLWGVPSPYCGTE